MKVAFLAGLSDKKLWQKLEPLVSLTEVERIDLYRRRPFEAPKVRWMSMPERLARHPVPGDLHRAASLVVRSGRYDLIVGCHQPYHGVIAWMAGKLSRTPVVQLVITEVDLVASRPLQWRAVLGAAACGVRGPVSAERVRTLGYGRAVEVVANPFTLPTPSSRPPEPAWDVIAVGDLAVAKDYPWMMEVLAGVAARRPELRVAVCGRGPWERELGPALDRGGLRGAVSFLGWQGEEGLRESYLGSRLLLLCSRNEGLPMVVLEAMAHGLPVVVTGVGELPWLVRDGVEGRMVGHGDTTAAVGATLEVLERWEPMGRAARARVEELAPEFDIERVAGRWRALLDAV